ncbi:MAG: ribbon-helix-helix domain-containing protein [Gulosibacter sp.]|uniref:ribbon-helix-helix domain-containing protein n=1 Tax=Gulosibacter sp. TaxID=2817531 RepID=UPI003F8E351C
MNDKIAKPENGSYGTIDGVEITEEVIARLVKNAEEGFPGAKFRAPGRPARTDEPTRAITVRLSESELAAVMARAEREHRSRSEAIRIALAEWANEAA